MTETLTLNKETIDDYIAGTVARLQHNQAFMRTDKAPRIDQIQNAIYKAVLPESQELEEKGYPTNMIHALEDSIESTLTNEQAVAIIRNYLDAQGYDVLEQISKKMAKIGMGISVASIGLLTDSVLLAGAGVLLIYSGMKTEIRRRDVDDSGFKMLLEETTWRAYQDVVKK